MEMNYTPREKIAGIFMLIMFILLLLTLVAIGRGKNLFKKHVSYYTTFSESYNLKEGAAVKLLDTGIGKVKKVSLLADRVRVELSVLEKYTSRIRGGTVATVESPTFIGSEYVALKPGQKDAPPIPNGGLIPSIAKRSIADLIKEFQLEKTAKMLVVALQDLSTLARQIRDPDGPFFTLLAELNTTARHLAAISGDIQAGKGTAGALLKSDAVLGDIRSQIDKADQILADVARASQKIPGRVDQVDRILGHIDQASAGLPETLDRVQSNLATFEKVGNGIAGNVDQIQGILAAVGQHMETVGAILAQVETGSRDVPQITHLTREGIKEIRSGVEDIHQVVRSLQKNILIRHHMPSDPPGRATDAGLRK